MLEPLSRRARALALHDRLWHRFNRAPIALLYKLFFVTLSAAAFVAGGLAFLAALLYLDAILSVDDTIFVWLLDARALEGAPLEAIFLIEVLILSTIPTLMAAGVVALYKGRALIETGADWKLRAALYSFAGACGSAWLYATHDTARTSTSFAQDLGVFVAMWLYAVPWVAIGLLAAFLWRRTRRPADEQCESST